MLEMCTEHRRFSLRLLLSGFVLNDIPVFHENAVLNAKNISRDPIHHCLIAGKPPMCDNEVSFGDDQTVSWRISILVNRRPIGRLTWHNPTDAVIRRPVGP